MIFRINRMDVDEYLSISGIQHFAFCKRQWALIHLEQQWKENGLTAGGRYMHRNADNPAFTETRNETIIARAVPLVSHSLCLSGVADVVEYHRSELGVGIPGRSGYYVVIPIEYKFGKKKKNDCDEVQLCAQAICLEEMLDASIPKGFLFYGKSHRRVEVCFTAELRNRVRQLTTEMYQYYLSGITPEAVYENHCLNCSLMDLCLPKVSANKRPVSAYVAKSFGDDFHA